MARVGQRWLWTVIKWYVAVGFLLSIAVNLYGRVTHGPTAFAWPGSWRGALILLFWWLVVPALTWPYELYWFLRGWLNP